jgi:trehalose 6-phosphate synthase
MWTRTDLQQLVQEKLGDYLFVVVSNRQPFVHVLRQGKVNVLRGAGGVISALDPVMQACKGLWVAYGNGDADRRSSDKNGKLSVPPENPSYTLKRVWLTKAEKEGYYYGYANSALWPLCHMTFQRPVFRRDEWEHYVNVNRKFARAILDELNGRKAFIWIQDYHLCLLPKFLKEMAPNQLIVAHFWHVPWPSYEAFRICPQKIEILEGLLSNDLLGFHIRYHCANFLDAVDRELESKIDRERFSVVKGGHETLIRPYPISVDFDGINAAARSEQVGAASKRLVDEFGLAGYRVLLGLDRLDYTKGIPERLLAIDRLLETHPELKGKIVFIQMGEISRLHIPAYKELNERLNILVEQINWKYSEGEWKPVILVRRHLDFKEILAFYRIGDVCVVSSLHDGMNLVAKEFVSSRYDEDGVLVLSQFAGASRELKDAVLVNPFDRDQTSEGIFQALSLTPEERRKRMSRMRADLSRNNIFRWAGKIISELLKFEFTE